MKNLVSIFLLTALIFSSTPSLVQATSEEGEAVLTATVSSDMSAKDRLEEKKQEMEKLREEQKQAMELKKQELEKVKEVKKAQLEAKKAELKKKEAERKARNEAYRAAVKKAQAEHRAAIEAANKAYREALKEAKKLLVVPAVVPAPTSTTPVSSTSSV